MAFVCLHVGFKAGTYNVCNVDIDNTKNIARKMFFKCYNWITDASLILMYKTNGLQLFVRVNI